MNLLNESQVKKAVENCNYVVHVASPVPLKQPSEEKDVIDPAFKGTLFVLRASQKNKVKRVALTSSYLAISHNEYKDHNFFDEKQWSDVKACEPYSKSKVLAEQAAWDFLESLNEKDRFQLVVLNPGVILGPTLTGLPYTSGVFLKKIMHRSWPGVAKFALPIVDVRDCAQAHFLAITSPNIT